jgi:hypothetical protein
MAIGAGLEFHKSSEHLHKFLTQKPERTVYHLVVNRTHMDLVENPLGYAICAPDTDAQSSGVNFGDVVKSKYFSHLGNLCSSIVEQLETKVESLQKTFILIADQGSLGAQARPSNDEVCTMIRQLTIGTCIGTGGQSDPRWDDYFLKHKLRFLDLDQGIRNVTQQALYHCGQKTSAHYDFLLKVYEELVTLHLGLDRLYYRYNTPSTAESMESLVYRMLIRHDSTSADLQGCANQFAGRYLSTKEAVFLLNYVYNSKIMFCTAFSDLLNIPDYDLLTDTVVNPMAAALPIRSRRWIWTEALASTTGLAKQSEVDSVSKNAHNILLKEEQDAKEIVSLENKTNDILRGFQEQNSKVMKLYTDEIELQKNLNLILADETDLDKQLSLLAKALEIVSDVDIQFSAYMAVLAQIPPLISETEALVSSVLTQRVTPDMLPLTLTKGQNSYFSLNSFRHADVAAVVTPKGFVVRYRLPEIQSEFQLYRLRTVPFPLRDQLYSRLKLENTLVAADRNGCSFLYEPGTCLWRESTAICQAQDVDLHRIPVTCAESLVLTKNDTPPLCKTRMEVVNAQSQSYVHHSGDPSKVTIFTPYPDSIIVVCDIASTSSDKRTYNISVGLTFVDITHSCRIETNELVILASTDTINEGHIPMVHHTDFSAELEKLADDLEDIHSLNMTALAADFASFTASVGATTLDLASATDAMKKSQHITSVQTYKPLSLNWEDGGSVPNTVTALSYGFLLLLVTGIALTCCQCCGCNVFTAIGKGIFKLFATLTHCAYRAMCARKKSATGEDISLDSSPNRTKAGKSTPVPWQRVRIGNRMILYADLPTGTIYFNHLTGTVEDSQGHELKGLNLKPTPEALIKYLEELESMDPPRIERGAPGSPDYLAEDPDIMYDRTLRSFFHAKTGKTVSGFKLPPA